MFHILNKQPRTINAIKGFHSGLDKYITHKHPSLWKLIDGLKVTENRARKKLVEYRRGDTLHQRAAYKRVTERLYNLAERYDSSMPMEEKIKFVKSVAHLINPN